MSTDDTPTSREREQTDESLRVERRRADDVLGDRAAAIADIADAVIEKARARADEVLAAARAKVDGGPGAPSPKSLERERGLEDKVLRKERSDADDALRKERAQDAALLARERDETDKDLFHERSRSDEAVATRDEFLGMVSHDLRDMLSTVVGFAALIARSESGAAEHRSDQVLAHARRIQRAGGRMNRLIGDLVDVASIEAGALVVTPQLGDPGQVVTEAVEMFQAQASASGVSLLADIATSSPVEFDPSRILQVLANLLGNALKFTPSGGSIVVHVEGTEAEVGFAVRDNGVGIPADQLEGVFERFRQIKRNDRRGVGLGLYISRCIVQGHGGRIWAESRPGEGSTFRFTLPVRRPG